MEDFLCNLIENNILHNEWYVEPFLTNVEFFDKIKHRKKIGANKNKELIDQLKQNGEYMKTSLYLHCNYDETLLFGYSLLYCDLSKIGKGFRKKKFFSWCRDLIFDDNRFIIKSKNAPDDFKEIFNDGENKLYIHISQIPQFKIN